MVKVTLIPPVDVSKRIGIAKGKFIIPDDIDEMNNEIFYSVISMWEVSIKHTAAKNMPISGKEFLLYCEAAGFRKLELDTNHVFNLETLTQKENAEEHKDPFDRMLLAQAKTEGMVLLTHDSKFLTWNENCFLVV